LYCQGCSPIRAERRKSAAQIGGFPELASRPNARLSGWPARVDVERGIHDTVDVLEAQNIT
jgi:hypothetical protein